MSDEPKPAETPEITEPVEHSQSEQPAAPEIPVESPEPQPAAPEASPEVAPASEPPPETAEPAEPDPTAEPDAAPESEAGPEDEAPAEEPPAEGTPQEAPAQEPVPEEAPPAAESPEPEEPPEAVPEPPAEETAPEEAPPEKAPAQKPSTPATEKPADDQEGQALGVGAVALPGNAIIAQSGGPTAVINQSLVGAIKEMLRSKEIRGIYGARHGIRGVLEEDFIDLRAESPRALDRVAKTPGAALGSVRMKPTKEDCERIFEVCRKRGVRYFFYIGGNDSAETAHIVATEAADAGYDMRVFHIPKTIDNDLLENDHTPGYGSAARFVALASAGDQLDNRSLGGVKINVIMGRHAGFLTAASVLAQQRSDDGPHLVYLPERPFDLDRFVADVKDVYDELGRCVVAVSEGIQDAAGEPVYKSGERDAHGNVQLSGTGALGDFLVRTLKERLGGLRVRSDTFGYLQRCFPEVVSKVDAEEAMRVAREAVRVAVSDEHPNGSIAIQRAGTARTYAVRYTWVPLEKVARNTRSMPDEFINAEGNGVTETFRDYALPLVGRLPRFGWLKGKPVQ